jgi:hypothetical protein
MAENEVVASAIPTEKVEAGKKLIEFLDARAALPINTALWMFRPELGTYRLVLGIPSVRVSGRKHAYKRIQAAIQKTQTSALLLSDVEVVDNRDPMINLLKVAFRTPPRAFARIVFIGNVINGVSFPDSYIYRVS